MRGLIFNLLLGTCRLCIQLAKRVSPADYAAGEREACAMAAQEHERNSPPAAPEKPAGDATTIACAIDGCGHPATTLVHGCDGQQIPLCAFDWLLLRQQMWRRITAGEQIHLEELREEASHLEAACDAAEWN